MNARIANQEQKIEKMQSSELIISKVNTLEVNFILFKFTFRKILRFS